METAIVSMKKLLLVLFKFSATKLNLNLDQDKSGSISIFELNTLTQDIVTIFPATVQALQQMSIHRTYKK